MPERQDAAAEVGRLAQAWLEQSALAETATRRAAGLMTIMRGYVQMFPDLRALATNLKIELGDPIPIDGAPRGAEAVRLIFHEWPDRWWRVSDLLGEMKDRGWMPESDNPANVVRTALVRLVANETSDVYKEKHNGKVVYAYLPDGRPGEPAPEMPRLDPPKRVGR